MRHPWRWMALLLLAVLAAEGLVRLRAHSRFGPYLSPYDLHERDPQTGVVRLKPNLSVDFYSTRVESDSRGFRSPELLTPKPANGLRLAFLGGSTTFCSQVPTNEQTWPALVAERLATDHPELVVEYLNAGLTGADMEDSLACVEHRLPACQPNVIVLYHATNELAIDTEVLAEAAGLYTEPETSWLREISLLWDLIVKNRHMLRAQREGPSEEGKLTIDAEALAAGFRERLTGLVERAREVAQVVALVTFSTRFRREQPRDVQLENMAQSFTFLSYLSVEDVLGLYEAYNAAIRDVASATGAVLIDGEHSIPGDAHHFADSVHFNEAGCKAMAERVSRGLASAPAFQELVRVTDPGS